MTNRELLLLEFGVMSASELRLVSMIKPIPPPNREWCDSCGWLKDGKHTSWMCKLVGLVRGYYGRN